MFISHMVFFGHPVHTKSSSKHYPHQPAHKYVIVWPPFQVTAAKTADLHCQ